MCITETIKVDYDNDKSDNCDYNFGTFSDFGVKNDQKVYNTHNMILMSVTWWKKGKKIRPRTHHLFGQCLKENVFFYVRCSLSKHTLKKFIPFPFEILSLHICIRLTVLDLCKIFSSKLLLSRSVQSMMVSWPAHFQFFFSFMSWRQFTGFLSVKLREIIHTKN